MYLDRGGQIVTTPLEGRLTQCRHSGTRGWRGEESGDDASCKGSRGSDRRGVQKV